MDSQGSKESSNPKTAPNLRESKATSAIPREKEKDGPMFLFRNGFGSYLQTGFLSDLRLIHSKKEYNVHQVFGDIFT